MRPLSSDLREFIHLLNTNRVKYLIVGASAPETQTSRLSAPFPYYLPMTR